MPSSHVYKLSDPYGIVKSGLHDTSHINPEVTLAVVLLSVELSNST